nr:recombinase family protein [Prosthecochloris sp. ZM]
MSITGVRPGAVTVKRGARTSSMVSSAVISRTGASVFERCGLSNYAARLSISLGAQGARKASVFSLKKAGVLENDGGIDTTTASGQMAFNIFATLAQFEHLMIQKRTQAGLKAAWARGRMGGRPKISANDPKVKMAKKLSKNFSISIMGDLQDFEDWRVMMVAL